MRISFADTPLELHGEGAAWFPEHKILCASDIHFEKGSFFGRFGTLLPPHDTKANLARLAWMLELFKPDIFISLGDAFHDVHALKRMHHDDISHLNRLIASVAQWIWVEGNHDPVIAESLGGIRHETYHTHAITFRHEAELQDSSWEISGHYHPKARIALSGQVMRLPCFVKSAKRLLMPAFGSYTGGLDVTHSAISAILPEKERELYLMQAGQIIKWSE